MATGSNKLNGEAAREGAKAAAAEAHMRLCRCFAAARRRPRPIRSAIATIDRGYDAPNKRHVRAVRTAGRDRLRNGSEHRYVRLERTGSRVCETDGANGVPEDELANP